ncbi:MAG: zf-HC2 domain-containing protein [Planctomycetaceae bacterium]|nr:zf-HC2 domain-containing protein [Planctomycetaceae bacterium]
MTDNRSPIEKNSPDDSGWGECPPGEISGMLNRLSRQRKLAASAKISAVAAALLVGAGIWQTLPVTTQRTETRDGEYQFGSICCSDVIQYAAAFKKGELDTERMAQIRQHIAECPHCRPEFEKDANQTQSLLDNRHGRIGTASLAHSGLLVTTR